MPKATYKTKGVSPSLIPNSQHQYSQAPVADQAWNLTLPKVSGNRGYSQSSIESHLGNLVGGPSGPNSSYPDSNTTGVQAGALSQELQQGESGEASVIPDIHLPQQHGRLQLEGTRESHRGYDFFLFLK